MEEKCARCHGPATQRCAGCQRVFYCTREHQKLDWKQHRMTCSPIKVDFCENLGRFLRVTRPISEGEIVIKESPLVFGPSLITPPVCLGCLDLLPEEKPPVTCNQCGWPMCSEECIQNESHLLECTMIQEHRGEKVNITKFGINHPTYQVVTVLRCLALQAKDPKKWNALQKLEGHEKSRERTSNLENERSVLAYLVRNFFKMDKFSEEEILRISGILQVNGHEVPTSEPPHVAVYEMTSFLEHSCRPNCSKSFSSNGKVIIRTVTPIAKGEHLSICYSDALWGTINRRHHLSTTKFFWCKCTRCADPTELGTHFSSVRCVSNGCDGYLVAVDPLEEDLGQDALIHNRPDAWRCLKCSKSLSSYEVFSILENIGETLIEIGKKNAASCEKFIVENKEKLHPNHYYITDAKIALAQMLGQESPNGLAGVSSEILDKKQKICHEILNLIEILVPAETRLRGVLKFELHAVLAETARRKFKQSEITHDDFKAMILSSRRFLLEAHELLRYEAEILPEGKIAAQARRNITELELILRGLHIQNGDSI